MKFIFKHWEWGIVFALVIWYLIWLAGVMIRESKIPKNKEVVAMPPSEIEVYTKPSGSYIDTESYPYTYRTDYYGIKNLDRTDSIAVMNLISNHFRESIDTVLLEKYRIYHAMYYENDANFNNGRYHYHNNSSPLFREAANHDAFVCNITCYDGKLHSIRWYPDGEIDHYINIAKDDRGLLAGEKYIPLTTSIEGRFRKIRSK